MAKLLFNFTSKRETDYRLVRPKQLPPRKPGQDWKDYLLSQRVDDFEPTRIVGNGVAKRSIQIVDPMLFERFSKLGPTIEEDEPPAYLDGSEQALRDFVRHYGRLTDDKEGDNVYLLLDEAGKMKHLLETFRRRKRRPPVAVFDLEATVSLDPKTGNIDIRPWPQTLLQALWLQLVYFLSRGGGELRECKRPGCTNTFPVGAGGKRKDAKFCSKECQVLFNSLERSNPALREKRK